LEINSVDSTVNLNLCISCGICKLKCEFDAIELEFKNGIFVPAVDSEKCISCKKCISYCPGMNFDVKKSEYTKNIKKLTSYVAYSKDNTLRQNGTSGGVITDLLCSLIVSGEYDYACVVDYEFNGTRAELKLVSELEDIKSASKSKYLPVSIEKVLSQIKKHPELKYVVVATPCISKGIKTFLKSEGIPETNVLILGLFCDGILNHNIFGYYEKKYGNFEKLKKIMYRTKEDSGWPGNTKLIFGSGNFKYVNRSIRMLLKNYFTVNRCRFCIDKFNEYSDISFGDCYIPEKEDVLGTSNIIILSEKGKKIFEKYSKNFIIEDVSIEKVLSSQKFNKKDITVNNIKIFQKTLKINKGISKFKYKILYRIQTYLLNQGQNFDQNPRYYFLKIEFFNELIHTLSKIKKLLRVRL
jgi:coenzyme F420 hydrogenase subunit beta